MRAASSILRARARVHGANYPSDVLAGWALGGVWASVCLTSAEVFRRLREAVARPEELEIARKG